MKIISNYTELKAFHATLTQSSTVGLVPTMGALHEGHLSLVKQSMSENTHTVVSIFVNPTQFNDSGDFEAYPRTIEQDLKLLEEAGISAAFVPEVATMYPEKASLNFNFGAVEMVMEGKHRPGHFNGVGIVVSKLFNLVQPHRAYFGEKDLQQVIIIEQLVQSLSFPIDIVRCPIERDNHGLALSSRNRRLSEKGISTARDINMVMSQVISDLKNGTQVGFATDKGVRELTSRGIEVEYLELGNSSNLEPIEEIRGEDEIALCFAGMVEGVRLIDNMTF